MIPDPQSIVDRLKSLQIAIQKEVIRARGTIDLHKVDRFTSADTIYRIDALIEPIIVEFCYEWCHEHTVMLIAEGIESLDGREGFRVFPDHMPEEAADFRLIIDPIDGTRGIMYDKRPAWSLAAVAPNLGEHTRLSDIQAAVMTELPTSKAAYADTLSAIRGRGFTIERSDLRDWSIKPIAAEPSSADTLAHGFGMISNFFPATKVLAGELMDYILAQSGDAQDPTGAVVFEDQYISTGGQFYELIVGHDRLNADLRPYFYKIQKRPPGLCCHPYDCGGLLIAQEAGVQICDGFGQPLDGPLDCTTGLAWTGYANEKLKSRFEPLISRFLSERGIAPPAAEQR